MEKMYWQKRELSYNARKEVEYNTLYNTYYLFLVACKTYFTLNHSWLYESNLPSQHSTNPAYTFGCLSWIKVLSGAIEKKKMLSNFVFSRLTENFSCRGQYSITSFNFWVGTNNRPANTHTKSYTAVTQQRTNDKTVEYNLLGRKLGSSLQITSWIYSRF